MNDYTFGNYIYKLRTEKNLSQLELGKLLGVSDKAISKWENGKSKPQTEILKKLTQIFDISFEKLLNLPNSKTKKTITKIVITGGPCAGKTTAMNKIQKAFTALGYSVIFIPETATELIS